MKTIVHWNASGGLLDIEKMQKTETEKSVSLISS